jgi:hypothetical protein
MQFWTARSSVWTRAASHAASASPLGFGLVDLAHEDRQQEYRLWRDSHAGYFWHGDRFVREPFDLLGLVYNAIDHVINGNNWYRRFC